MKGTRRVFLGASAGVAVATWLRPVGAKGDPGPTATLPFVGEGAFPLDTTIGAGLGRRRALDLSTLSLESLLTPQDKFFIRTGTPDLPHKGAAWTVRLHGLVKAPMEIPLAELAREADDRGAHLLECAGNARTAHFGLMSAARWTGVPLERVLRRAQTRNEKESPTRCVKVSMRMVKMFAGGTMPVSPIEPWFTSDIRKKSWA